MEVYLVVPESGYGYYVYKDKSTATYIRQVSITFKQHEEKANRYTHLSYKFDDSSEYQEFGRSGDGLNKRVLGGQIGNTYWKDTNYTRVDSAQDLSYVESQMGNLPDYIPYGKGVYDGFYKYSYTNWQQVNGELPDEYQPPFVYAIFDMNFGTNRSTLYYMMKEDMLTREVTYDLSVTDEAPYTMTIGSQTFKVERNTFSTYSYAYLYIPVTYTREDGTVFNGEMTFTRAVRSSFDLQTNIQADLDWYNEMNPSDEGDSDQDSPI